MYDLVTYASKSYMPVLRASLKNWINSDVQNIHIYTDKSPCENIRVISHRPKGVVIHFKFDPVDDFGTNCARKAIALYEHMNSIKDSGDEDKQFVVFLDADCRIVGPLDIMFHKDFDIGVTVYPEVEWKHQLNNVSAGAMFLQNNLATLAFLRDWVREQEQTTGPCRDQASLSSTLRHIEHNTNMKIARFDCDIHNHHPRTGNAAEIEEFLDKIKQHKDWINIIHFAHGTWKNKIAAASQALGRVIW